MSNPIPVKFPPAILKRLQALSGAMGESLATTIRAAAREGLILLEREYGLSQGVTEDRSTEESFAAEPKGAYRIKKNEVSHE